MQGPKRGEGFFWFHNEKKIKRNAPPVAERPRWGTGPSCFTVSGFLEWECSQDPGISGLEGLPATLVVVEVGAALARLRGI